MSMTFETGLKQHVAAMPNGFTKRRYQHILDLPADSWRRQHALLRLETAARNDLGVEDDAEVDWTPGTKVSVGGVEKTIDWQSLLQLLAKLLPIILAFFGA